MREQKTARCFVDQDRRHRITPPSFLVNWGVHFHHHEEIAAQKHDISKIETDAK
jgi:hypothetical protein